MEFSFDDGAQTVEVSLRVEDTSTTFADVLAQLTGEPIPATVVVDGMTVAADATVSAGPLRNGSRIAFGASSTVGSPRSALEWVAGGRCRSLLALETGTYSLGSSPEADIVVDDNDVAPFASTLVADADGAVRVDGRLLEAGECLTFGSTIVRFTAAPIADAPISANVAVSARQGTTPWRRPPRQRTSETLSPLPIPAAETAAVPATTFGMATGIVVLAGSIAAWLLFKNPIPLVFGAIGLLSSVAAYVEGRRRANRQRRTSSRRERQAEEALAIALEAHGALTSERRRARHPSPSETLRRALTPSVRLWERRPDHDDFMVLALGWAQRARFEPDVTWPPGRAIANARAIVDAHRSLSDVPVEFTFSSGVVLGLTGDRRTSLAVARSLLIQAAVHHGPADIRIVVGASAESSDEWDWAKWLPHCLDRGTDRFLARDRAELEEVAAAIRSASDARLTFVVLDDAAAAVERASLIRQLLDGQFGPACALVLAPDTHALPSICTAILEPTPERSARRLRRTDTGETVDALVSTGFGDLVARDAARAIARFTDPESEGDTGPLPAEVGLADLLGRSLRDADAMARTWIASRAAGARPSTALGVAAAGIFEIDIVRDGPHVLVGGTTGAGKSELLRTFVAGLAAALPPDELSFLFVDYKGGGAFAACTALPHSVGLMTDLDPHLSARALRCLEAELRHRERLLRDAKVSDFVAYRVLTNRDLLTRLVVIVDEFATLAKELPEFVDALVGVAQRGRSLGMHLVLATQRPAGVVNDNIRANTNLRIALRMQSDADAMDVANTPSPARFDARHPGRALVRTGAAEPVTIQTAHSGRAVVRAERFRLAPFTFGRSPSSDVDEAIIDGTSELDLLVTTARAAAVQLSVAPPRRPWTDSLADCIPITELSTGVALVDDPDHQRHTPYRWDAHGNLTVYGARGAGKTTALLALAVDLARTHTPTELALYAVDMGAGTLDALEVLPHTASAIRAGDTERHIRLLRTLDAELARRRGDVPYDRPRLVIVIDGVADFITSAESTGELEALPILDRLASRGPEVGITLALATDRTGSLPRALAERTAVTWLLRPNDRGDYSRLGVTAQHLPVHQPAGRAVDPATGLELQIADPSPVEATIAAIARSYSDVTHAPRITVLHAKIQISELMPAHRDDVAGEWTVPVGVRSDTLGPAELIVTPGEHILVSGPARAGRSTALAVIVHQLRRSGYAGAVWAVAPRRSPLRVHGSLFDATATTLADLGPLGPDGILVVDDAELVDDTGDRIARLTGRDGGVSIIAAARNDAARSAYGHWLRTVRQSRRGLLLAPDLELDGDLLGVRLPRRLPPGPTVGRGFVVDDGDACFVQVAQLQH
ncbi:MAG: FtsK/SpoIIIE domain-containing protein [Acidimicrobiia bacterium]